MSSTPPLTSRSIPFPRSDPPAKALTHPTLSPRNDIPIISRNLQSPGARLEPSGSKPTSQNVQANQPTPKPRHHIPHHPHRHRAPAKSVQAALLQSTAYGELLSPVKSTAGGFAARGSGEERHRRGAKKELKRDEGELDPVLRAGEAMVRKEATWADVTRQKERRMEAEK